MRSSPQVWDLYMVGDDFGRIYGFAAGGRRRGDCQIGGRIDHHIQNIVRILIDTENNQAMTQSNEQLKTLLTLKHRKQDDASKDFDRIAKALMNEWVLRVHDAAYRIGEVEFYLQNADHDDTYTHGHELQKTEGLWYFHASGMDLTFGQGGHGGILIRGVLKLSNDGSDQRSRYTTGPQNVVREVMSNIPSASLTSLDFGLEPDREGLLTNQPIFKWQRIGLNKQHDDEMAAKPYRYLILRDMPHKDKARFFEKCEKF